ncbi:hypothetical protein [Vibrio litoralis]|uniref:hypothetical protein n=1 Tax=Vibrio litoralis TaxID=335972 RepID=UPI0003F9D166|nr:hypothetical protein [Vibrio litoralis]
MARHNWAKLREEFEQQELSLKEWCKTKRLNHNTARKHIKSDSGTSAAARMAKVSGKEFEPPKPPSQNTSPVERINGVTTPFVAGNNFLTKHGGYKKYLDPEFVDVTSDIPADSLADEIAVLRARFASQLNSVIEIEETIKDLMSAEEKNPELISMYLNHKAGAEEAILRTGMTLNAMVNTIEKQKSASLLDQIKALKLQTSSDKDKVQTEVMRKNLKNDGKGKVSYEINW